MTNKDIGCFKITQNKTIKIDFAVRCHGLSVVGYKTNKIKRVTKESLLFSRDKLICNKQFIGPFCLNCSCYFYYL